MAKAKKRGGKGKAKKTAVKRKPAAAAPRPVAIPGAWPFPMGSKS